MWGMIWILLFTLALGFIAGYRYSKSRYSTGPASGYGSDVGEATREPGTPVQRAESAKLVDPVCHKAVSPARAKPSVHRNQIYYLCSRECREIFEANPGLYIFEVPARRSELVSII